MKQYSKYVYPIRHTIIESQLFQLKTTDILSLASIFSPNLILNLLNGLNNHFNEFFIIPKMFYIFYKELYYRGYYIMLLFNESSSNELIGVIKSY